MTSTVLTCVDDGVATLTLNRPQEMNAFDADDARAIVEAIDSFAADPEVRVLVLGGAGKSFSAGGDFNWVLTWPNLDAITRRVGADAMMGAVQAIYDFPKPSIARVHGAAVGGGIGLMLACDFAIAASSARFGLTSVRNGLLAGVAIPVPDRGGGPPGGAPAHDAWRHIRCRDGAQDRRGRSGRGDRQRSMRRWRPWPAS